jgi:hypothetical protein
MMSLLSRSALIAIVIGIAFSQSGCSQTEGAPARPHFELEASSLELQKYLDENPGLLKDADARLLQPVLELGKRNLNWLVKINGARDAGHRISLSSKETTRAYPIEKPRESNTDIVLKSYHDLQQTMPREMAEVVFGTGELPNDITLEEAEYIRWGNEVDHVYQAATRWLTMKPYLDELKRERKSDVRGYYLLSQENDLETKLNDWKNLKSEEQSKFQDELLGVCGNSEDRAKCKTEFATLLSRQGSVKDFWLKYKPASQTLYESFFKIQWFRTDIVWSGAQPGGAELASIPVIDPNNAAIASYLKDNVEDEWKWQNWELKLVFQSGDPASMTHLLFQPGVTAHVEVPNKIVMDENQPTSEYDSQWTIRHEFGHILGFPDCYVEFYDEDRARMVNYQLDTTNLMCSRRGVLQQKHFDEMKRVYSRAH